MLIEFTKQPVNVFRMALYNEIKSRAFYNKAAEITKNNEARMLFLELTDKEDDHVRLLVKKMGDAFYDVEFDPEAYINYLESSIEKTLSAEELQILQTANLKEVFELSISMKKKSMMIYITLAKKEMDTGMKSLYQKMAEEENGHLNSVTRMHLSLEMVDLERPPL